LLEQAKTAPVFTPNGLQTAVDDGTRHRPAGHAPGVRDVSEDRSSKAA